jgi:hypothetical protein
MTLAPLAVTPTTRIDGTHSRHFSGKFCAFGRGERGRVSAVSSETPFPQHGRRWPRRTPGGAAGRIRAYHGSLLLKAHLAGAQAKTSPGPTQGGILALPEPAGREVLLCSRDTHVR